MPVGPSVICSVCHRTIAGNAALQSHMRSMHTAEWRIEQEAKATPFRGARTTPAPPPTPSSNGIRWEDPPPRRHGSGGVVEELAPLLIELRRNPGRWARLKEFSGRKNAQSFAQTLARRAPDMEFVARVTKEGSAIWARYVEEG